MTTLCVVGSVWTAWTPEREVIVCQIIQVAYDLLRPALVISGQSPGGGVDDWSEELAKAERIPFKGYPAEVNSWEGGESGHGYKWRNRLMAQHCTHLLAIRSTTGHTYGSGWTADYAARIGRIVSVVML